MESKRRRDIRDAHTTVTFKRLRAVITQEPFLLAKGRLQIYRGDQPTVYVTDVVPLPGADPGQAALSHDFH
jgi:hypothetical protein